MFQDSRGNKVASYNMKDMEVVKHVYQHQKSDQCCLYQLPGFQQMFHCFSDHPCTFPAWSESSASWEKRAQREKQRGIKDKTFKQEG